MLDAQRYLYARQADGSYLPEQFKKEDLLRDGMVCIRYNNYWCVKSADWQGEIGKDARNHAEFGDPVSGARAFARLMYTYRYSHWLKTTNEIVARYAPSDDCVGSIGKPPNCPYGINPVKEYADQLAIAVGKKASDDLELFDEHKRLNLTIALPLFVAFSQFELTRRYKPSEQLILAGIKAAGLSPIE